MQLEVENMNLQGIIHRCAYTDCYARNENELVINIRTNKDITAVNLIYEDPYINGASGTEPWDGIKAVMNMSMELKNNIIWTLIVTPKFKRLQYYFEIIENGEKRNLLEDGLYTDDEMELEGFMKQYFKYAWMNSSDIYQSPKWVEDTFWYQIMPDRFCRIPDDVSKKQFSDWNVTDNMKYNEFYGGNLKGIISRLTYLRDLGINGIYLTPIFQSDSDHKYNTTDYKRIDEDFGTEKIFKEMVDTAHNLGIKVMIDAVFNHSGRGFFAWQDVLEKKRESKYYDWFFIQEDDSYYSFAFVDEMPKLNTNNKEVADYFCQICREWIEKWNIDGIRFDVGNEISHSFIKKLHRELKSIKPDLFLLGEIWHDSVQWLQGDEYDSVMNYPFMESLNNFFVNKNLDAEEFMFSMNRCYSLYMSQVNSVLFNFLDSHDVGRVYSRCGNIDVFLQQLVILVTMPGTPCIYYGTEIAMDGKHGPYNRKPMPWEDIDCGKYDDIMAEVRTLIGIRKKYKALKNNQIQWKNTKGRLINYVRPGDVTIEVYINVGEQQMQIDIKEGRIIFAHRYMDNMLFAGGALIVRRDLQ